MSLPECGFENNTKFSSVRKREILHLDIFDAVLSIKMTELVPKTKMTCSFVLNSIIMFFTKHQYLQSLASFRSPSTLAVRTLPLVRFPTKLSAKIISSPRLKTATLLHLNIRGRDSREIFNASS